MADINRASVFVSSEASSSAVSPQRSTASKEDKELNTKTRASRRSSSPSCDSREYRHKPKSTSHKRSRSPRSSRHRSRSPRRRRQRSHSRRRSDYSNSRRYSRHHSRHRRRYRRYSSDSSDYEHRQNRHKLRSVATISRSMCGPQSSPSHLPLLTVTAGGQPSCDRPPSPSLQPPLCSVSDDVGVFPENQFGRETNENDDLVVPDTLVDDPSVVSARERIENGRSFALLHLPSQYFLPASKKEKKVVPHSGFQHHVSETVLYPAAAKWTIDSFSAVMADRKESGSLPLSVVDYPAAAYRLSEPLWNVDHDNYDPFPDVVTKDLIPPVVRQSMRATSTTFDILAFIKTMADAQVNAMQTGFRNLDDVASFQSSCEAIAQAASDGLALSALSLSNATLAVRTRALRTLKTCSSHVRERAQRSQLSSDCWFGPAARQAFEEERRDPMLAAKAIGGAISGALTRVISNRPSGRPPFRGSFRGASRGQRGRGSNRGVGRGANQLFSFTRGRSSGRQRGSFGRGRGADKSAATPTKDK